MERRYLSPPPPPKISLKHDLNWTKGNDQSGSTVEHQPVGKLSQQSLGEASRAESSKPTQSKLNPICDRTEKPVEMEHVCRSKAKAKPQRSELAGSSPRIVPIERRNWIDIEPGKHSLSDYEVSKILIHLFRHGQHVHREEDGADHFWRIKENLPNPFPQSIHWSDD